MRRREWAVTLALAAGLALPAAVLAQSPPPSAAFLEGTEAFRRIIFDTGQQFFGKPGFQPLGSFDELGDPKHTILIVFGEAGRLKDVPGGLRRFVERGGALFLATDRPLHGAAEKALLETAGVGVVGQPVVCETKESCYHGLDYCPFLRPNGGIGPDLFRDLASADSTASVVATNAPSCLMAEADPSLPQLEPVAWLPDRSHLEIAPGGLADDSYLFGVGGDLGAGRVLVLADHSIFINEMMLQRDDANVEFSYNCLKWLSGVDGWEQRTKVLFVEDGAINTKFEVPLKEMPDELVDRILDFVMHHLPQFVDKSAAALEWDIHQFDARNGFDREALGWLRHSGIGPDALPRVLLVVLAVGVVLYGCWKVGFRARYRSDLQGPVLATALSRLAPVGGVAEQRRRALFRDDNLWESARDLARECVAALGAPAGPSPPRVRLQGGRMRRWAMAARVKRLWRLAYGPPVRVSKAAWPRLVREMQTLKAALADGTVQFP